MTGPGGEGGPEQSFGGAGLVEGLARLLRQFWPRRAHTELLLDLGERKGWNESDRLAQLQAAASWLESEAVVGAVAPSAQPPAGDWASLREVLVPFAPTRSADRAAGTSSLLTALAPAVGAHPKTLANSLRSGVRPSRPDHRWLLALGNVLSGPRPVEAWLFHRRTPGKLSSALAEPGPDAGGALLALSLLALWQRRRPKADARGSRGQAQPRRRTPKPVAALGWQLIAPGQFPPLLGLATGLGGERGSALGLLAIECALTEAHLGPHPSRGAAANQAALIESGEAFLRGAETALCTLRSAGLVESEDAAVLSYRIARMRAWRDGAAPPTAASEAQAHRYVAACVALDERRTGKITSLPRFRASTPGLAMLLPQLRAAGARILP